MLWGRFSFLVLVFPCVSLSSSLHTHRIHKQIVLSFPSDYRAYCEGLKSENKILPLNHFCLGVRSRIIVLPQGPQLDSFLHGSLSLMGNESATVTPERRKGDGFLGSLSLFLLFASLFAVSEMLVTLSILLSFFFHSFLCNPPPPHLHTKGNESCPSFVILVKSTLLSLFVSFEWNWMMYLPFLSFLPPHIKNEIISLSKHT